MVTGTALAKIVGGIFIAGGTATVAAHIGAIVINLGIAALLGKVLAPSAPKTGRDVKGLQTIIRSNIAPRRIIYGEAVTGGPYLYLNTTGDTNQWLNMIVALSAHPIEDVIGLYINEEYINISGNTDGATNADTNDLDINYYVNSGKYGTDDAEQHVQVIKNLGWGYADFQYVTNAAGVAPTNDRERGALIEGILPQNDWFQPFGGIVRDSGTGVWPAPGHKVTNCAYIFVRVKFNRDVWSGFPKLKFHVKGKRLYNPYDDNTFYPDEGAHPSGDQRLENPDTWKYYNTTYSTQGGTFGEDWTLCILDYLLNTSYGLGAKVTGTLTEINWEEFISSYYAPPGQGSSSELIPTGDSINFPGDQPRYTINGVLETNSTPISNIEALLTSGGGELIYAQGKYKLRPAVYRPPNENVDIINEDMIVSPLTIRTHTPRSDLFNKASGVYVNQGYDEAEDPSTSNKPIFEPTDFKIVDPKDETGVNPYEIADEEEIIKEFDYPFTTREYEAQRLARIQLERVRQGMLVSFEANMQVLKYSVGDNVYLEILSNSKYANEAFFNRLGLDDQVQLRPYFPVEPYYKQFKILEMQYTENSTISVTMIEESEEVYDWNDGDANTTDYILESEIISDDPTGTILSPIFTSIVEIIGAASGTTVTTKIYWNAPDRGADLTVLDKAHISHYRLEYGEVDSPGESDPADRVSDWIFAGSRVANHDNIAQGPLALETLYKDGVEYDFRLQAVAYSGRASAWAYYSVDSGSDYSPSAAASGAVNFYYIRPVNGTAIKNGIGTLTVEARTLETGTDELITSGNKQLYVGTTLVSESNGYQPGSDGYTGIFDAGNINNSVVVELREGSGGNLLDTISLVDIADGDAAGAGEAAVFGYVEATNGLAWVEEADGTRNPDVGATNLDVTFVKGGSEVARWSRQISRNSDGTLTDSGAVPHQLGSFNTDRVTPSVSGNGTYALTVKYDYLFDTTDVSFVAETVISTISGQDGVNAPINYAKEYSSFETSPPTVDGASATASIDNTVAWLGNNSLKVVANAADGWVYLGTGSAQYNLLIPANQQWILSAYVRLDNINSPKTTSNVDLYLRAGDGTHYNTGDHSVAADGAWHRISGTLNLTSNNSTTALLRVDNDSYNGAGNTTMYFDGIQLEIDPGSGTPGDHADTPPPGDDGDAAYSIVLTNEAHTLPVDTDEVVDYTGSGTSVRVYKGDTELDSIASAGTPTTGEFDVTAAVTTGTVTVGAITTSGLPAVVANHSNMTTDSATITYTINAENLTTITKVQSLAKASAGGQGNDGLTALASFAPGHVGGQTDFIVTLNEVNGGTPNDGEIRVQGTTFQHPDGTVITTDVDDFAVYTNYEGTNVGRFYIAYSATVAETRFGGIASSWGAGDDTRFYCATWDATNGWRARQNNGTYYDITIVSTDCILAVCEKLTASGGIETFVPLYGGLKGADGAVGWTQNLVFSAFDSNTVEWEVGTVWAANGDSFNIVAGDTGNMASSTPNYIYVDSDVSTTVLQKTTTPQNAVGENRILIAVAEDVGEAEAFFQVFGGRGGALLTGNNIVGNSIVSNNIATSAITTAKIDAGAVEADKISVSKLVSAEDSSELFDYASTSTRVEIEGSATYPLWYGSGTKTADNAKMYLKDDGTMKFQGSSSDDFAYGQGHIREIYPFYNIKPYRSLLGNTLPPGPQLNGSDIGCPAIAEAGSFFTTSNIGVPVTGTYAWPTGFGPGLPTIFHPTETTLSGGVYSPQRIANEATPLLIMATARVSGVNSTIELQYRLDGGSWVTIRQLWSLGVNHSFYEWWQPPWNGWSERVDFRILLDEQASGVLSYYSFQIQVIGFNITAGYRS